jgi:two-component system, chemotaxis family, sensor kinase CheA
MTVSGNNSNESLLEMYLYETSQNIEQLEQTILSSEQTNCFTNDSINEIFRIMHTIKGSSAMMLYQNISTLAHSVEDLFYFLREQHPQNIDSSYISDLVLNGIDFIKIELEKIKNCDEVDGDAESLINDNRDFLQQLKQNYSSTTSTEKIAPPEPQLDDFLKNSQTYSPDEHIFKAVIYFKEGCDMENVRAFTIINNLKEFTESIRYIPHDIIENQDSSRIIKENGFIIYVKTDKSYEDMFEFFMNTIFLKELELTQLQESYEEFTSFEEPKKSSKLGNSLKATSPSERAMKETGTATATVQSIISVNVSKLDKLMDLVGEMVIAEAMVIQNPDISGLELENFHKASRQLHKITTELQDMVMSIRMVPLAGTFHKMQRIVRDMSKKLNKEVKLEIIGEETEVDKNIIEHISDPLMHLVRNAIDHGIEDGSYREDVGKQKAGTIILEAKNAGNDVLVIIKDDGKGLNKEKLLSKARENELLSKPETEMSDREIYNLILIPGFSTNNNITEFSGRGVGMDVVIKNIEAVGGSVSIDSVEGKGTSITLKIPLTLAIIDGMNIRVANSRYTIPITAIKESFKPKKNDIITDPDGNEMIMLRGRCYPILRLHECYGVKDAITDFTEGILIVVEQDEEILCLFADELLGQQQVVVKTLPSYLKNTKKIHGLAGCTLLGDGSISLILDIGGLLSFDEQRGGP